MCVSYPTTIRLHNNTPAEAGGRAIGGWAHCNSWNGINGTVLNIWKPHLTLFHFSFPDITMSLSSFSSSHQPPLQHTHTNKHTHLQSWLTNCPVIGLQTLLKVHVGLQHSDHTTTEQHTQTPVWLLSWLHKPSLPASVSLLKPVNMRWIQ